MELLANLLLPGGYTWGPGTDQGTGVMTPSKWPTPIPYYVETDPIPIPQERPERTWHIRRFCLDFIVATVNSAILDSATAVLRIDGVALTTVPLIARQPEGNNFLVGNSSTRWYFYTGSVEFNDPLQFDVQSNALTLGVSAQIGVSSTGTGPFFIVIKGGGPPTNAPPSQIGIWGRAQNPGG